MKSASKSNTKNLFAGKYSRKVFEETVGGIGTYYVEELKSFEREALLIQTEAGLDWFFSDEEQSDIPPVWNDEIVLYLKQEFIYRAAESWTNPRIRKYLEESHRLRASLDRFE